MNCDFVILWCIMDLWALGMHHMRNVNSENEILVKCVIGNGHFRTPLTDVSLVTGIVLMPITNETSADSLTNSDMSYQFRHVWLSPIQTCLNITKTHHILQMDSNFSNPHHILQMDSNFSNQRHILQMDSNFSNPHHTSNLLFSCFVGIDCFVMIASQVWCFIICQEQCRPWG